MSLSRNWCHSPTNHDVETQLLLAVVEADGIRRDRQRREPTDKETVTLHVGDQLFYWDPTMGRVVTHLTHYCLIQTYLPFMSNAIVAGRDESRVYARIQEIYTEEHMVRHGLQVTFRFYPNDDQHS
jgi:hypothetical protein